MIRKLNEKLEEERELFKTMLEEYFIELVRDYNEICLEFYGVFEDEKEYSRLITDTFNDIRNAYNCTYEKVKCYLTNVTIISTFQLDMHKELVIQVIDDSGLEDFKFENLWGLY